MQGMDGFAQQAMTVLTGKAKEAFDLSKESDKTRERYGKGLGEELLLARRLCEAGAGFVTLNNGYWDHHGGIIPGLKELCPPLDHAVSVFVDDVRERGQEKNILLLVTGEFGRTPRINGGPGRDHWAPTNCALLAGGGVKRGQIVGRTDELGYHIIEDPIHVHDLQATILHLLGMDHTKLTYRHQGRDFRLTDVGGKVVEKLLA